MKSLIRKTEINWSHFAYGIPFLIIGFIVWLKFDQQSSLLLLLIGGNYSIAEILLGENPQ